jgi:hypothetical protein
VTVNTIDDNLVEGTETFNVNLSNVTGNATIADGTGVGTINDNDAANQAPTANAGPDQTVASGAPVTLNGSGSTDPENQTLTYMWTQTSGPSVTLSDPTAVMPTFTAPTGPATLTFQLQVCDPEPLCSTDSVTINVSAPAANQAPTANAGPDQTVASGASVQLDGSGSTDPENDTLTYMWTAPAGITLSDPTSATPTFTAPTGPATLTFQLQVCDQEPLCDTDTVVVNVQAPVEGNPCPTSSGPKKKRHKHPPPNDKGKKCGFNFAAGLVSA